MAEPRAHAGPVLVIDDNYAVLAPSEDAFYDREMFLADFGSCGFQFSFCSAWDPDEQQYSVPSVLAHLRGMKEAPGAILLDVRFGDQELLGLEILDALTMEAPAIPVVMMTSAPRETLLDQSVSLGSIDYLVKPIQPAILRQTVRRYYGVEAQFWLVGHAEPFLTAVDGVARAAEGGTSSVLLLGASGTGKELFARYLHRYGSRGDAPFQPVHIPSIPEHLVEGELFGYSKGAFTGAIRDEPGRLCRADGGVLFLDEVGDLSATAQAALLRILETREVIRLGDGRTTSIDVQVVAATNSNLAQRVKANSFRLDLYSRLSGTIVHLPPLAARKTDLDLLLRHLLRRACLERGIPQPCMAVPRAVIQELAGGVWEGNVRDLWNFVQRVLDMARGGAPTAEHFEQAFAVSHADPWLDAQDETALARDGTQATPPRGSRMLNTLPAETVRGAAEFVEELTFKELSLLYSALQMTRDPVSGQTSRAKAAALLKAKPRCSTNEFDRWLSRLLGRLAPDRAASIIAAYPDLAPGLPLVSGEKIK